MRKRMKVLLLIIGIVAIAATGVSALGVVECWGDEPITLEDHMTIAAAPEKVWEAIRDPSTHAAWHPFVTHISGEHALGAARECDVTIDGKPGHTRERCTSYEEGREITWRIEEDSSGFSGMVSDWTAGFTLESKDGRATIVTAHSRFRPNGSLVCVMMPVIRSKFHETQRAILDALARHLDRR